MRGQAGEAAQHYWAVGGCGAAGRWALGLRIPAPGLGSEDDASPFGLIQPSLGFPLARPV